MKPLQSVGNYGQCPYCLSLFGNGISIVYENIIEACNCIGMRQAREIEYLKQEVRKTKETPRVEKNNLPEWPLSYTYHTSCLINNKEVKYDACGSNSLNESIKFYGEKFKYIGSSNVIYFKGKRIDLKKHWHFFVKS